ncbi:MAG: chitobiase/beta-hexosaminidase C-terminal domain-containing protein, partial [Oscillospiraceae bacterium]|nr:chitobiase/beta-hexosaminidase C-terminal domain-containing protein [Oscillospiraceae bacterium]
MKNMGKRILALFLILALAGPFLPGDLGGLFGIKAYAQDGSEANPYLIYTTADFITHLRTGTAPTIPVHYKQMADIDLRPTWDPGAVTSTNMQLSPNCVYDGNGFTINVTLPGAERTAAEISTYDYTYYHGGVFRLVYGTVKNTHVYINNLSYDITHTGNNNTLSMGGIAGMVSGGQILNSSVTGSLTIQMDGTGDRLGLFTGGVAGEALTRTRIDGCYINMNLTAYGNSNVRHAIYAGSVAGRVMFSGNANEGAKITNNLIESTTVELQNGRAFTWQYAPAFAGGIAGWIDQQTFGGTTRDGEVRGNVLRSTRARSYMGSGSAGGGSNKQGMALALCPRITISMAPIYANAPRGIHSNYLDGELSATAQHTWSGIGNFATSAPYATSQTRNIHGITYQDINSVQSVWGEVAPVVILNNVGLSAAALNTNNSAGQSVWASGAVNAASGELIRVGGLTAAAVYPEWMFFNVPTVTEKVETAACVCEPVDDPARNCGCYVITTPAQDYVPANPGVVSGTCPGDSATPTDGPCTFTVANPSCIASGCNKELVGKTDEIEAKDAVWTKSSCGDCQLAQKTWVFTFSPPKSPAGGEKDMNARNIFFEITYTNQAGTEKTERVVSTATGGTSFTVGSINVVTNEATRIVRLGEEPQGNSVITVRTWAGGRIGEAPFYVATDEKYFFPVSSGEWSRPPLITTVSTAGIDQGIRITRNRTDNTSESINYQVVAEGGSFYGVPPNMWQARLISWTTTLGQGESITIPYSQIRGSWSSLRVTAHATVVSDPPDDTIPQSGLAEVIFDSRQKPVAPAPNAIIGRTGSPPSQNDYYAPGDDRLIIERPATVESTPNVTQELHPTAGILRYTLNGSVPSAVNGFDYPSDGVLLPVNQPSVIINAALIRENYPPSETASFTVNMRVPYGQPIFSIGNDSGIHVGQPLSMLIDERDLPDALMPSYYRRVGDSTATPTNYTFQEVLDAPGNYYGVIVVRNGTNAKSGASFTSYNDYASSLPQVEVSFGTASVSRMYAPPQPEIRFENSSGEVTSTQPHVWRTLTLTGAAGESVSVFAQMRTNNPTVRLDGLPPAHPVTFNFHPPVQNVTAAPLTSADNVIAVALNTPIILSSATPPEGSNEVSIFYSLSGTPSVNYDSATGVYTPNFGTHIYNRQTGIPVTGTPGSFFTIFAGAVRSDMSPSGISEYTYRISALDAVAAPVASPHTSLENITTVENNSRVVLTSGTSGARIFYSFTGMPQVSFNSDTGQYVYDNVHTLSYDNVRNTGIQLSGTPGSVASIHAVALRENMSDSSVVTFTYRIAALPMSVLASPAEGTVVSDTEVTLSTSTPDAIIFYEIGRRESDTANPTVNVSQVYRAPIKISANTYIKAVAFNDGVSSTVTSFDYRLANQVGRPEPSIPSGSVVARGTLLK